MKKILTFLFLISSSFGTLQADTFDDVITIFESKCQSCHNATQLAGNLNLSGSKSEIHNAIFEKTSSNAWSQALDHKIIDAGYPERSTLYRSINDGLYDNIELNSVEDVHANVDLALENWEKELIRQWIYHGGKQNGTNATGKKQTLIDYYQEGGLPRMEKPQAPAPQEGFQLYLGTVFLQPGQEWEMVYKYELKNPEPFEVNRINVEMSEFSHHFLFFDYYNNDYQSIPDGFRTVDYISIITNNAVSLGEEGTNMIAGWAYSNDLELPQGTAYNWEEDAVLKFNYHLKNYSSTQVYPADLYVNVYTQPVGTAVMTMHSDFLINAPDFFASNIPSTCDTIYNDDRRNDFTFGNSNDSLHIWNLGAHTHKLGVDYDLYLSDASGNRGEQVYEGTYNYESNYDTGVYDYSEPSFRFFNDDFLTIRKADGLIQEGKFLNCTGSTVNYGLTTNDEMLGFFVQYLVGDLTDLRAYQDSIANLPSTSATALWQDLDVKISPNPNNGVFTLNLPTLAQSQSVFIEIYDLSGKRIWAQTSKDATNTLDLQQLNKGVYLLKVQSNGAQSTQKLAIF